MIIFVAIKFIIDNITTYCYIPILLWQMPITSNEVWLFAAMDGPMKSVFPKTGYCGTPEKNLAGRI